MTDDQVACLAQVIKDLAVAIEKLAAAVPHPVEMSNGMVWMPTGFEYPGSEKSEKIVEDK